MMPKTGLYYETNDSIKNEHPHSYLWPLCALIQATNEAEATRQQSSTNAASNQCH